jgi:hypothetical protein
MVDDPGQPMAETCRRVGEIAEAMGVPRPSYVHLRRYLVVERARQDLERSRRDAVRAVLADSALRLSMGRFVNAYEVADRIERAKGR